MKLFHPKLTRTRISVIDEGHDSLGDSEVLARDNRITISRAVVHRVNTILRLIKREIKGKEEMRNAQVIIRKASYREIAAD